MNRQVCSNVLLTELLLNCEIISVLVYHLNAKFKPDVPTYTLFQRFLRTTKRVAVTAAEDRPMDNIPAGVRLRGLLSWTFTVAVSL